MYILKKSPPIRRALIFSVNNPYLLSKGSYANVRLTRRLLAELNCTVNQCEESVVLTHTHVVTGVVYSTSLTYDDVAGLSELTTEKLYTESLAL